MEKRYRLQLFAEGGDGGTGASAEGTAAMADGSNQLTTGTDGMATVNVDGTSTQAQDIPAEESFENLIKGKYKKDFNDTVKSIVEKRLAKTKAESDRISKLNPGLQSLASRYGLDANTDNFYEQLNNSILNDEKLYEDEAIREGKSVQDIMHSKQLEMELAQLKAQQQRTQQERERQQFFQNVFSQVPDVQKVYKNFDIDAEMQNQNFFNLVRNGISVQNAYEVIHKAELDAARNQVIAQKASEQISNSIKTNAARPNETGANQNPADTQIDFTKLTRKDIQKMFKDARDGKGYKFV